MSKTAESVEILKAFIRSNAPGKCKLFTEATTGVACECPLCCVDHLFAEACKNAKLVEAARVLKDYVDLPSSDYCSREMNEAWEVFKALEAEVGYE